MQEFADKGSLADAIRAGRFRRKLDGSLDTTAILKCLNDVASGAPAFVGFVALPHWKQHSFAGFKKQFARNHACAARDLLEMSGNVKAMYLLSLPAV